MLFLKSRAFFQKPVLFSKARAFFKIPCFFSKARTFFKSPLYLASLVQKMIPNTTTSSKKEKRRERDYGRRKDSFGMEYVRTKYPKIYGEALEFYEKIRKGYPTKHDLRKTTEFRQWKREEEQPLEPQAPKTPPADNLQLRVPLWDTSTLTSAQNLETVAQEVLGEGTIYPSLQDEIPSELIEEVLTELREDPDLKDIFETDFEQLGAGIVINEDNRLEDELCN